MRVVNIKPRPGARFLIGLVPIVVILIVYAILSAARLEANPNDRVLPTFSAMGQAVAQFATQTDPRTGQITAWSDTIASLYLSLIHI